MEKNEIFKSIIREVNRTLDEFEAGWWAAKRWDFADDIEKCDTFDQFIEIRFNHECFLFLPEEYQNLVSRTDGHLFSCRLEEPNNKKRRFQKAVLILLDNPEDYACSIDNTLTEDVNNFKNWLGGDCIEFTSQKKKFIFNILNKKDNE